MENNLKLGILGCGKMGSALMRGITSSMGSRLTFYYYDPVPAAMQAMSQMLQSCSAFASDSPQAMWEVCDIFILAVKPKDTASVLTKLSTLQNKPLLISVVVGLSYSRLAELCNNPRCVRVMPNTPCLLGQGVLAIEDNRSAWPEGPKDFALASELLGTCGKCYYVANEAQMDAVGALSGSSPALFAVLIEAMADAGVAEGLPRELAINLARDSMLGTARLLEHDSPMKVKADVMSPAGTTAAGIIALERAHFSCAVMEYVLAASEKSRKMF